MGMRRLLVVAASAAVATSEGIGSMGAGAGRVIEVRLGPPRIVVPCAAPVLETVVDETKHQLVFRLAAV